MKLIDNNSNEKINIRRIFAAVLLTCSLSFILSSCKEDDKNDTPNPSTSDKGALQLHLHNYMNGTDMGEVPNLPNTTGDGREVKISVADLYISEFQMVKLDGSVYSFSGKRILKVFGNVLYVIGDIPVGNYNTIHFKVGLDPATNALHPSSSPDSTILNKPEMWFSSTAQPDGYVFLNIQGSIDTSDSKTGTPVPFAYKIGTNANYKQVSVSGINITIVKGQMETAHMVADYDKLLSGIPLKPDSNLSVTTPAENSLTPATIIADSIPSMFKIE